MKKWLWAAVPAIILGVYTSIAIYSGTKAEQALRKGVDDSRVSAELDLQWSRYDQGVFSSKAVLDVIFTPMDSDDMFRHSVPVKVVHGPLLLDKHFGFRPALFGIKGVLVAREDWPADLKTFLANDRVHFETFVGFDGRSVTEFNIDGETIALSQGELVFHPFNITAKLTSDQKNYDVRGQWDGMFMKNKMGELQVKNWSLEADGEMLDGQAGNGKAAYRLEEVSVIQQEKPMMSLKNLGFEGSSTLKENNQQMDAQMSISVAEAEFMSQQVLKQAKLVFDFKHLSVAGLRALSEANKNGDNMADPMNLLANIGQQFVEYAPEINLNFTAEKIMQQPVKLKALIKIPAMPNGFNPEWTQSIAMHAEGQAPLTLLQMAGIPMPLIAAIEQGDTDARGTAFTMDWIQGQFLINNQPFGQGQPASSNGAHEFNSNTESYQEEDADESSSENCEYEDGC